LNASEDVRINDISVKATNEIIVNSLNDLPTASGGFIDLLDNTTYIFGSLIVTPDSLRVGTNTRVTSTNSLFLSIYYTGIIDLFTNRTGVTLNVQIDNIRVYAPLGNFMDFIDPGVGLSSTVIKFVNVDQCKAIGLIEGVSLMRLEQIICFSCTDGVAFIGSTNLSTIVKECAWVSTDVGYTGIDFNGTLFNVLQIDACTFDGPAGAVGFSGQASSGNINAGQHATVVNCTFSGGLTPLVGITTQDIQWDFTFNLPITVEDSRILSDIYLSGTDPEIVAVGLGQQNIFREIGTLSTMTWSSDLSDRFTVDLTNGFITYIGDRTALMNIRGQVTVAKVGGGADALEIEIAKNWTSGAGIEKTRSTTDNAGPSTVPVGGLVSLTTGDNIRIILRNVDSTANIEVHAFELVVGRQ
jgi:hypothetical protein